MDTPRLLLFAATVLPLICTPGPDMLFIASQALGGRAGAGLRATAGVCAGYVLHSLLVTLGLAALLAASPLLFAALRWAGVLYLAWLALRLIRSALRPGAANPTQQASPAPFRRGFLTAALNPKGMTVYFAILPQFMHGHDTAAMQALLLSAVFIALCALVYTVLSLVLAWGGRGRAYSDRRRRCVEGVSGGLVAMAAGTLAAS
ncbi:LysE family translocator [Lysobacter silvisoli]|uniref:LysE family translocator n=1 Tax=Lysobacter silvisoli TaxID=2293254 RepID=A0A371K1N1_9GAMM|nr:LysE family translocator [Lysobacter silvisoli]RDZ27836.1 LysE family translocator [Lysobacter silvisoli]